MTEDNLTSNLRLLTGYAPSIKRVCLDAGINRTQYHRYLTGEGTPSLRSLRRICDYFGIEDFEIMMDQAQFREIIRLRPPRPGLAPDPLAETMERLCSGDAVSRIAMGFYHMIFQPDPSTDIYYRSVLRLRQLKAGILIKGIERFPRPAMGLPRRLTYEGAGFTRHGKLFCQMQEVQHRRSTWFSVLSIGDFANPRILQGMTTGCEPEGAAGILSFPVVWLHLSEQIPLRKAMGECGYFRRADLALSLEMENALDGRA